MAPTPPVTEFIVLSKLHSQSSSAPRSVVVGRGRSCRYRPRRKRRGGNVTGRALISDHVSWDGEKGSLFFATRNDAIGPPLEIYCGASECQVSDELRKSLGRDRNVEDDPERSFFAQPPTCTNDVVVLVRLGDKRTSGNAACRINLSSRRIEHRDLWPMRSEIVSHVPAASCPARLMSVTITSIETCDLDKAMASSPLAVSTTV